MANIELATAYVNVLPSTNQLARGIRDALRDAVRQTQAAGNQMGNNLSSGITSNLQDVGTAIRNQLNDGADAASQAGNDAGDDFSTQFSGGIRGIGQRLRSIFDGSVADAGDAGSDAGQRFSDGFQARMEGFNTALAGIGLAAGAAVGAAVLEGATQEAAADKMAAALGLNPKEQKKFGGIAGALYKDGFGESVADNQLTVTAVLAGLPEMRSASKNTVKGVADDVMTIADLTGEDAETVVNAAKQMVVSGLAKNHKEAMDMIMRGNQLGLNSSQDMLDTFTEYSPYFAELGLSGKQTLGILSNGLKGGARNLDVLGDSFKEFSIIAKDGSDTAKEGFKAVGIDAGEATKAIGKGGPAAAAMTAKVIEGLKKIKDPLKQEAAGVALFGTMWEDNSKAILATDLSGAEKSVGKLSGAVDKAGKTAYDNAVGSWTVFYRTLKESFVEYVAHNVLPMLMKFGMFIKENATAFKILGGVILGVVAAAMTWRAALWAVKITQDAIALGKWIAGINLAAARQKIVAAATRAWAFAQRMLNTAFLTSPLGLVIAGLALLVGGLILAYKKSETFRNIVNQVWASIKTAIVDTWNNYIKPALMGFWGFIKNTLWPIIQQLWTNVIKPVFGLIGQGIALWWTGVKAIFNAWKFIIVNVLWPVLKGLWTFVSAVFSGIWSAVKLYWGFVKGVFNAWKFVIMKVIWPALKFLWTGVKTVFNGIWTAIKAAWGFVKGVFQGWKNFINNVLAPAFRWLRDSVVKPVFDGIKNKISSIWNNGIKPIFNALKNFITDKVKPGFKKGIDAIGVIWSSLKKLAAKPINFLIEWVYNKGIRKMINLIPGVKDLPAASPIKFARGGAVNGGIKGKDSVSAMLMPGEHVWTTKEVNAMGGQAAMYRLRDSVRKGQFSLGESQHQHFAKGGAVQNPSERVYWDGEPITRITAAQLSLAQQLSGSRIRVMQGSWQPRTSYSGSSHTGPGVVDTSPGTFNQQYHLRRVGFAAWARNIPGAHTAGSGAHIHSVSRLDPGARGHGQLSQFARGGDGLGGRDYGPNPALLPGLMDKLSQFGNLSVYGGKGGDNSSWLSLIGDVKDVISNIRKWASGGLDKFGAWGSMMGDAAKNIGNNVVQWINDKIPNRFLPDNPIPSIFDTGGVLEPGMLAYNASRKPEAVFNHSQFKSFAESAGNAGGMPDRFTMTIDNWDKGTGYIRSIAADEVDSAATYNNYRGRMGNR